MKIRLTGQHYSTLNDSDILVHSIKPSRSKRETQTAITPLSWMTWRDWTPAAEKSDSCMWRTSNGPWRDTSKKVTGYSCCISDIEFKEFIHLVTHRYIQFVFQFNPERKLSKDDPHYNSSPSDSDKVHILVFVVDASTIPNMKQEDMEVIEDIRDEADEMGKSTLNRIRIISVFSDTSGSEVIFSHWATLCLLSAHAHSEWNFR